MTKIFNFALKIEGGGREGGTCEVTGKIYTNHIMKISCFLEKKS